MRTANSPTFPKTSPGMGCHLLRTTGKARKILQDRWDGRCWDMKGSHRLEQPPGQGAAGTKEIPSWQLSLPLHTLCWSQMLGLCQPCDLWGTQGKHCIGASHHQYTVLPQEGASNLWTSLELAPTWTVSLDVCSSRRQSHTSFFKPPKHHEAQQRFGQARTQLPPSMPLLLLPQGKRLVVF